MNTKQSFTLLVRACMSLPSLLIIIVTVIIINITIIMVSPDQCEPL